MLFALLYWSLRLPDSKEYLMWIATTFICVWVIFCTELPVVVLSNLPVFLIGDLSWGKRVKSGNSQLSLLICKNLRLWFYFLSLGNRFVVFFFSFFFFLLFFFSLSLSSFIHWRRVPALFSFGELEKKPQRWLHGTHNRCFNWWGEMDLVEKKVRCQILIKQSLELVLLVLLQVLSCVTSCNVYM